MISYTTFIGNGGDRIIDLVDIKSVPEGQQRKDIIIRNNNIKAGFILCFKCDGTGNEYFFMRQICDNCSGTGRKEGKNE